MCVFLVQCQSLNKSHVSSQADGTTFDSFESYAAKVSQIQTWTLDAKLGFVFQQNGKQKAVNTSLDWQQDDDGFKIVVSGPLGFGRIIVDNDGKETRLTNHQGEVFTATSPEALFFEHTGMNLPWSDLYWWIRGLPVPDKPHKKSFASKKSFQVELLRQSGWLVEYAEYQMPSNEIGKAADLSMPPIPKKIRFRKGDMSAKIVIRDWAFSANSTVN